jgi:hypothetical protein
MAFGLAYNKWCVAITAGGTTLVNVFIPPGGGFLDQVSATAWGTNNAGTQTATALLIQTAI